MKTGYKNWKAAMEKYRGLKGHENSGPHITAMVKWESWMKAQLDGNIAQKMNLIGDQDIIANRHYLKSVAQTILVCSTEHCASWSS